MKKIGKKWLAVLLCLTAIFAIFGFVACGEGNPSGGGKTEESAVILSVDGASIDGLDIFMFVDKDTDSVSLANKVVCSDDSIWKLYYDKLGQVEIPTKIAADISGELLGGDNLFYIVVTSQNGEQVNVYEMNVYRSYAIDVCYYNGNKRLKTETAYTGYEFTTDYVPNITGYTFNGWNYTPKVLWDNLKLYADKTANTYTVTYDVNGGDELTTTEKTVTYDGSYTLTKPTRTEYTFLGWYYGETQLTDGNGNSLVVWNYAKNLTAKAEWERNDLLNFTYTTSASGIKITGVKDTTVKEIVVPKDIIAISEGAFRDCSRLTSITVATNNTTYKSIEENLYSKDGTTLIQYAIGKMATSFAVPDSVTGIGSYAFSGCSSLKSVTIDNSVTSIGDYAFHNCWRLTSATLPAFAVNFIPKTSLQTVVITSGAIGEDAFV